MTPSPSQPGSTPPIGARAGRELAVTLAPGIELVGERPGSGSEQQLFLIRRGDGRMVEVSSLLYQVAAAIHSHHHPEDVARIVSAAIRRHVTVDDVSYLVEHKLAPLGVVSDGAPPVGPTRLRTSMVRIGVFPAKIVGHVAGVLGVLFLPSVVLSCVVALGLFDVWLVHNGLEGGLQTVLGRVDLTLAVVALTIAGGVFHELGHAAASRYGGANPGVIGVGIYLLWPVFYNDLNDSYRLGRAGRLRCDLGGVYFNGIFAVGLALVYTVTRWDVLLVAVVVQHLAMLQQFLPFLRLDGYYVVSDLTGTPDLYRYVGPVLRSLISGHCSDELLALKRRSRAMVTAWVLTSIPLLVLCAVAVGSRIPSLFVRAWNTWTTQWHRAGGGWNEPDPGTVVLGIAQSVIYTVPIVGVLVVTYLLLRAVVLRSGGPGTTAFGRATTRGMIGYDLPGPSPGLAAGLGDGPARLAPCWPAEDRGGGSDA